MTPIHATDRDSCRALLAELGITRLYALLRCPVPDDPRDYCAAADLVPVAWPINQTNEE